MTILYLTQDLLFSSRVAAIARNLGVELSIVGDPDQLNARLAKEQVHAVLVDLEHRAAQPQAVLESIRQCTLEAQRGSACPKVIGYGPHVKESLLEAARTAGFDLVLSRGQFDKQIAQLLQSLANPS